VIFSCTRGETRGLDPALSVLSLEKQNKLYESERTRWATNRVGFSPERKENKDIKQEAVERKGKKTFEPKECSKAVGQRPDEPRGKLEGNENEGGQPKGKEDARLVRQPELSGACNQGLKSSVERGWKRAASEAGAFFWGGRKGGNTKVR